MMDRKLVPITTLSREEILAIRPGTYSDDDLLDLVQYFDDQENADCEYAIIELILRSPLRSETVDTISLINDLVDYYQLKGDFESALRWTLVQVVYVEYDQDLLGTFPGPARDVGEAYLRAGQWSAGLGLLTRMIERNPQDVWTFRTLGSTLLEVGQDPLAIEVLERGLVIIEASGDIEGLREQFEGYLEEARDNPSVFEEHKAEIDPALLQALCAAIVLPPVAMEEDASPHRPPLDRLVQLDRAGDPAVDAEILTAGKALIPELMHLAMDESLWENSAGPWHAARLLNHLRSGPAPELESLANWLDRTEGDDWQEWNSTEIGKVGGYRVDELEAMARDAELDKEVRGAAIDELTIRVGQQPALNAQVIQLLRGLLNRPGSDAAEEEFFTATIISAALDLEAVDLLPDIEKAFSEDRVDRQILDENFVNSKFNLPRPPAPPRRTDGLYLRLRCNVCQRVRAYFTRFVIIDNPSLSKEPEETRSPYILDQEIVCPKCGAVDQYHLQPLEMIKLMQMDGEQIAAILAHRELEKPLRPHPRVFYVRGEAFGKEMHPLDAIDAYRRLIAIQPKNADLHIRLGNSLRFVGRYEQALQVYRQAVEMAPQDTDVLFTAATGEHDFGDLETARRLYARCLAAGRLSKSTLNFDLDENVVSSMQGLQALDRGETSPWDYRIINANGVRLLPPPQPGLAASISEKKDKRAKRHGKRH